nr:hypothetical protein [Nitrospiraceae bacterium]
PLPNEGECCATFYHIGERVDAPYFFDNWKSPHTLFLNREYYRVSATQGFDRLMTRKLHFLRYYTVARNVNDFGAYLDKSILVLGDDSKVGSLIGKRTPDQISAMPNVYPVVPLTFSLKEKTANRVSFEMNFAENLFLLYTDLYHSGFRATIDGRDTPVLKAMEIFKAVEVPAGLHTVEFIFEPSYRYLLLFYLTVSSVFLIGMIAFGLKLLLKVGGECDTNTSPLMHTDPETGL